MNNPFNKIEKYLNRKKPKPDYDSDKPVRPKISIHYHTKGKEYDEQYATMNVDYNFYSMTIVYRPYKLNPYSIHIEGQATFGRVRQELGTRFWDDEWSSQDDVVDYIRYKLR